MTCVDKDDIVGTLVLDFCKAFDLVNHDISLTKLSTYKFGNSALKLFTSYIPNRQQVMDSGKGYRNQPQLNHVCPRAPFLGPTLFLIFINDMHLYMSECDCDLYADDATAHTSGKSKTEVETKLQK